MLQKYLILYNYKMVALNSYFEAEIPAHFGWGGLEKQQGEEVNDLRKRSVTRAPGVMHLQHIERSVTRAPGVMPLQHIERSVTRAPGVMHLQHIERLVTWAPGVMHLQHIERGQWPGHLGWCIYST